jgi:uncharacterized lipoprotein YmbA
MKMIRIFFALITTVVLAGCATTERSYWETEVAKEVARPASIPQCELLPQKLRKMVEEDKSDVDAAREYAALRKQAKQYRAQIVACQVGLKKRDG